MQRKSQQYTPTNQSGRSEEIQRQIQALTSRDWQLWSIGILVMLVLGASFLAVMSPTISWQRNVQLDGRMLPQLFFGLIVLIVLFNVYVVSQKRTVNATRHELIRELVFSERMDSLSMLDPVTQLLNSRGVDHALNHEVARANRLGADLSIIMMKLENFAMVSTRYGGRAVDKFVADVAKLLKSTFRGADIIARYSDDDFLVILPNTNEHQAECARQRTQGSVENWNLSSKSGNEISFAYGVASYAIGSDVGDLIRTAQRKATVTRALTPIFLPINAVSGKIGQVMV